MTLHHSPSIVRDGLVLYYDMSNTKKSFKGMPTTNILPYPEANWTGSAFDRTYWHDATSTHTMTYVTGVTNPIGAAGVMRYTTGTTGYKYWALRGTVPSAGTYTFSYYARVSSGGSTNLNNSQLWRNVGVADQAVSGDWNPTITNEWKRFVTTGTVTTALDYFPIHSGSLTGGYTIDYCGFQLEAGSVASPWVKGTRSNTQSLIDLTGNKTLTVNSLTYESGNTFSFNGTSSYISCGNFGSWPRNGTISFWMKSTAVESYRNPLHTHYLGVNTGVRFEQVTGGVLGLLYGNDAGTYTGLNITNSLSQNVWVNVATTWNVSTGIIKSYFNGALASSASNTYWPTQIPSFTVGSGFSADRYYKGYIGVVQLYNKTLTDQEILRNYQVLQRRYGL